jgi:hypothetical protein
MFIKLIGSYLSPDNMKIKGELERYIVVSTEHIISMAYCDHYSDDDKTAAELKMVGKGRIYIYEPAEINKLKAVMHIRN